MLPRVHIEMVEAPADVDTTPRGVPPAVAWAITICMIALTLSGSAVGAAATFGVAMPWALVAGGMVLLALAATVVAPRLRPGAR